MKCPNCLTENAIDARQCKSCGTSCGGRRISSSKRPDYIRDYFAFRQMITPFWTKVAHVIGMFSIMVASAVAILFPYTVTYSEDEHLRIRLGGLLLLIVGSLVWRVLCEGIMVIFRMYASLERLDDRAGWLAGMDVFDKN